MQYINNNNNVNGDNNNNYNNNTVYSALHSLMPSQSTRMAQ